MFNLLCNFFLLSKTFQKLNRYKRNKIRPRKWLLILLGKNCLEALLTAKGPVCYKRAALRASATSTKYRAARRYVLFPKARTQALVQSVQEIP